MSKCLTDNQISAFVDGELANDAETFSHLNSCANCFEQVTTVRNFIEENRELSDQINQSYDKMVSDHLLAAYFRRFNRKVTDFIQEDLIATSPSFLGELLPRIQRLDNEHRKITNTPVKGTIGMLKIMVIILMIMFGKCYILGKTVTI